VVVCFRSFLYHLKLGGGGKKMHQNLAPLTEPGGGAGHVLYTPMLILRCST
jgi:hypothetical protein